MADADAHCDKTLVAYIPACRSVGRRFYVKKFPFSGFFSCDIFKVPATKNSTVSGVEPQSNAGPFVNRFVGELFALIGKQVFCGNVHLLFFSFSLRFLDRFSCRIASDQVSCADKHVLFFHVKTMRGVSILKSGRSTESDSVSVRDSCCRIHVELR